MRSPHLAFSIFIHILVLVVSTYINVPVSEKTLPIEISEVKKTTKAASRLNGTGAIKKSVILFPPLNLFAKYRDFERSAPQAVSKKVATGFNDPRAYDNNIDEIFGEDNNQNWSYFQEVYKRIDSHLMYDSILAQYGHFGRVYVQFQVTSDGIFKLENLKTSAQDMILKVHVLRAINRSLSEPFDVTKKSKSGSVVEFRAEFDFLYGENDINFDKQKNFGRPVLVFKRATIEKPVPDEMLEQLLDGGVTPNISLMYENWQKYNKKKHRKAIQFDPFEGYKKDAFYLM
ncbi:MAG: hypothetical protein ACXVAX_04045 [Pseudobdellovibrio sp.]